MLAQALARRRRAEEARVERRQRRLDRRRQVEALRQQHLRRRQARKLDAEVGVRDLGGAELARRYVDICETVTILWNPAQTATR